MTKLWDGDHYYYSLNQIFENQQLHLIYMAYFTLLLLYLIQESRAAARKPRDAETVLFGLKFANDIHYKLRCRQASIKQGFEAPDILTHCVVVRCGFNTTAMDRFHVTILMDVGPMTTSLSNTEHRVRFCLLLVNKTVYVKTDLNARTI